MSTGTLVETWDRQQPEKAGTEVTVSFHEILHQIAGGGERLRDGIVVQIARHLLLRRGLHADCRDRPAQQAKLLFPYARRREEDRHAGTNTRAVVQ